MPVESVDLKKTAKKKIFPAKPGTLCGLHFPTKEVIP